MIFDNSKVYTAINADELHKGDIVYLVDTVSRLKYLVSIGDKNYFTTLDRILNEEERHRFVDENYLTYNLAYLLCPARNAEAFKAWHEGKKIEMEYAEPDGNESSVWKLFENEEPNWYYFHYRPAQEKTAEKKYRAFISIDELVTEFKKHFNCKTSPYVMPLIWVKPKSKNEKHLITGFTYSVENGQLVKIDNAYFGLGVLFRDYEFLDNSPCGVKIER